MKHLIPLIILILTVQTTQGQDTKHLNLEDGIAVQGYDVVAYFEEGKAQKGKATYSHEFKGSTYWFASAAHLATFQSDPAKYEPQYGGWCAYAMGVDGSKVEINPKTFKIKDGKLYLFYNAYFNNTLPKWNAEEQDLMRRADQNWAKTVQ